MAGTNERLAERIAEIVGAKGAVPEDIEPFEFCRKILPLLGTTDGRLREYRVYGILHLWAIRREMSDDEMRWLLWTIADEEHLLLDIGERESDAVYMRSFSVLVLGAFVRAHREKAYLASEDLARCEEAGPKTIRAILDALGRNLVTDRTVWRHEEDARAASVAICALKRESLTDDQIEDWLASLVPNARYEGEQSGTHWRFVNAWNVLR